MIKGYDPLTGDYFSDQRHHAWQVQAVEFVGSIFRMLHSRLACRWAPRGSARTRTSGNERHTARRPVRQWQRPSHPRVVWAAPKG